MNKANKIFKKKLEKEYNRLIQSHTDGLKKYCEKQLTPEEIHIIFISSLSEAERKIEFPEVQKKYEKLYAEYTQNYADDFEVINNMKMLIELYDLNKCYIVEDIALKYLKQYNFQEKAQAEVYAFILNKYINKILSVDVKDKETILKIVNAMFDEKTPKILKKLKTRKLQDDTVKKILNDQTNCHNLRNVIDNEGNILPFQYATNLEYIFERTDLKIPKEMFQAILKTSEQNFYEELEQTKEEAKKRDAERKIKQAKKEEEHNFFIKQEEILKHQKQASRLLKHYIINEKPTGYISSEDLLIINSCLNVLNFTDESIMRIQKNIIKNNEQFEQNSIEQKLKKAKAKYLSEEERELMKEAEKIIADKNSRSNPLFSTILENYKFIKEELLNALEIQAENDIAFSEKAELIVLSMVDLSIAVDNFKTTDYHFVPKRIKEGN